MKTLNQPQAWICSTVDNGRKKLNGNNYYLKNQDFFKIELFNPTDKAIIAIIAFNSEDFGVSGIKLRPGERLFLDHNPKTKNKLQFNIYEVDNSDETIKSAISENGKVSIQFFKEEYQDNIIHIHHYYPYWYNNITWITNPWYTPYTGGYTLYNNTTTIGGTYSNTFTSDAAITTGYSDGGYNYNTGYIDSDIKTDQSIESVHKTLNSILIQSYSYQILPDMYEPKTIKPDTLEDRVNRLEKNIEDLTKSISELVNALKK